MANASYISRAFHTHLPAFAPHAFLPLGACIPRCISRMNLLISHFCCTSGVDLPFPSMPRPLSSLEEDAVVGQDRRESSGARVLAAAQCRFQAGRGGTSSSSRRRRSRRRGEIGDSRCFPIIERTLGIAFPGVKLTYLAD